MSDGSQIQADDAFIAFAFAVVSVVMIAVFLPQSLRLIRSVFHLASSTPASDATELQETVAAIKWLPSILIRIVCNFRAVLRGTHRVVTSRNLFSMLVPRGLSMLIRPKMILVIIWIYLLVSLTYAKLAYDPYGVLGLSNGASVTEIKKAYRTLSRINHPDKNDTAIARTIFAQVRKAYKSLTKGEDEKEEDDGSYSVTVALPAFLTSRNNDAAVILGLLGVLILLPLGLWKKYGQSPTSQLSGNIAHLVALVDSLDAALSVSGVPASQKYVDRRQESIFLYQAFKSLGLLSPGTVHEYLMTDEKFPSLAEFRTRCLDPTRYAAPLQNMGLAPEAIRSLKEFFEKTPLPVTVPQPAGKAVDETTIEVALYLLDQWYETTTEQLALVSTCAGALFNAPGFDFKAIRRLERFVEELRGNLANLNSGKYASVHVSSVADAREKYLDIVREVPKEIQIVFQRAVRQQQGGR